MDTPSADIDLCLRAHARLAAVVATLDDEAVRAPSRLPGWSVGHLLTHLARNADSVLRRLDGARRDEIVDQYPGGPSARAAEIEAGAGRSAAELRADVLATNAEVDAVFRTFPEACWDRLGRTVFGDELPVRTLPFARAREVEVHLVDLGVGIEPDSWPPELAERWLPEILAGLAGRTDPTALLAWALRRGDAPDLRPF
jgi:maleylpyruvate isomerase